MRVEQIGDCTLYLGDCIDVLKALPDASVAAVVTDPPYHLTSIVKRFGKEGSAPAQFGTDGAFARASKGFMGKEWDGGDIAFRTDVWEECLRVLKPGGHMVAFSGTRTYHRVAVAIEDAGFEVRDQLGWAYASGFPKSHDVSKGIDKRAGAKREVVASLASQGRSGGILGKPTEIVQEFTAPVTEDAKQWNGWGSALKPSWEPICLARKPLIGTIVENVLAHGTGALNIDGCRIGNNGGHAGAGAGAGARVLGNGLNGKAGVPVDGLGKWPANLLHDGSDECLEVFGNHARMFFSPKAQKKDREEGLEGLPCLPPGGMEGRNDGSLGSITMSRNSHPTIKPVDVMRWLCRLITPPGGTVLDCFMGSGSTGKAAVLEGFAFIGIEKEEEYFDIACRRIADAYKQPRLFDEPPAPKPKQEALELGDLS